MQTVTNNNTCDASI